MWNRLNIKFVKLLEKYVLLLIDSVNILLFY